MQIDDSKEIRDLYNYFHESTVMSPNHGGRGNLLRVAKKVALIESEQDELTVGDILLVLENIKFLITNNHSIDAVDLIHHFQVEVIKRLGFIEDIACAYLMALGSGEIALPIEGPSKFHDAFVSRTTAIIHHLSKMLRSSIQERDDKEAV